LTAFSRLCLICPRFDDNVVFAALEPGTFLASDDARSGAGGRSEPFKTVSRVVNGEPGIGLATAARVRQAIGALGFHRNEIARSLPPGQASATVGLVMPPPHRRGRRRALVQYRSRAAGGLPALADAGLQFEDSLVRLSPHDAAEAESVAGALLEQSDPPTAIFATNNRMSIGVLRALRARGQRVALVGFDDFELADMLATPITVVAHDPSEMGRLAAELLFARLAGGPPKRLVLPTTLVVRGSGEIGP
jgi:DNA-binding LacI/PurR family transcriptional regulator